MMQEWGSDYAVKKRDTEGVCIFDEQYIYLNGSKIVFIKLNESDFDHIRKPEVNLLNTLKS